MFLGEKLGIFIPLCVLGLIELINWSFGLYLVETLMFCFLISSITWFVHLDWEFLMNLGNVDNWNVVMPNFRLFCALNFELASIWCIVSNWWIIGLYLPWHWNFDFRIHRLFDYWANCCDGFGNNDFQSVIMSTFVWNCLLPLCLALCAILMCL